MAKGEKLIEGASWNRIELTSGIENKVLTHGQFTDISAKDRSFVGVDFSFSVFTRAYFHGAKFERCKFIGCRFLECNFRGATFSLCDFKYSFFDKTIIPHNEIISNAPDWPNVARELMQILRANAESVGDYEAQKIFIREEMEACRDHFRRARERRESYYQQKYKGPLNWVKVRLQSLMLFLDHYLLGHGEHLGRAAIGSTALLTIIAVILFLTTQNWNGDPTILTLVDKFWNCFQYVFLILLDIPTNISLGENRAFIIVIVLLRYFLLGVLVAALWRRVSHR